MVIIYLLSFMIIILSVSGQLNRARCPPKCLCFSTTVRCMFLQLQQIPTVPPETKILDLRFNKIRNIPPGTFNNLKQLNTLLLNNNHIKKLQNGVFSGLDNLRYLYLYKNRIRFVDKEVFKNLPRLEQLYLHYNDLGSFSRVTFSNLPSLERLFLHNNRLHNIPLGAFRNLSSLKRLRLDSNALVCDCQLFWLAKMVKQKQNHTQVAATCEYPSLLQGKSLSSLTDKEFDCKGVPEILEDPSDVEVSFGGTAYFHCKVDGDPKPNVIWYHNNEVLTDDLRYNVLNDGTLMIENAQKSDMGFYECVAKNKMGEAVSKPAAILMADQPTLNEPALPVLTVKPSNINVTVGFLASLYCKAIGTPDPDIIWMKNDDPVSQTARIKTSDDGSLKISETVRSDSGQYTCQAVNHLGRTSASATLTILVSPEITKPPEDQYANEEGTAVFTCEADGVPAPVLTWIKNSRIIRPTSRFHIFVGGHRLRIQDVKFSDEGEIICKAQNSVGVIEEKAKLYVRNEVPPTIKQEPEDLTLTVGDHGVLHCKSIGLPIPLVSWRKDNRFITHSSKYMINANGTLNLKNVSKDDSGNYECLSTNYVGFATGSATVTVNEKEESNIGDKFFEQSLKEAKKRVALAINETVSKLFNKTRTTPPNPKELLRIFGFPQSTARDLASAAETVEQTLNIVYEHVQNDQQFNLTDFSYEDILSPRKLRLLTDLSGCLIHRRPVQSCDDLCYHKKYRTLDGSCNNLQNPMWGSALTAFRRSLKPVYENGFNTPVGLSTTKRYYGYTKPSARLVSTKLLTADEITQDEHCTHMLMQWGQFLDHDIDHALPAVSTESFRTGIPCQSSCDFSPPCFPIAIPRNDPRVRNRRCMEFIRSSAICGSGMTSVFFNKVLPREQINLLTSYIDASQVYSSSNPEIQVLRDRSGRSGQLRRGIATSAARYLLPFSNGAPIDCRKNHSESVIDCFLAGDVRANEQVGLLSMHTIFFREHNRIAEELESINPHWDSDTIFHETRKIIGAFAQHITYQHWLPHIIGKTGMQKLGNFSKYDPTIDSTIANVFATAAFRFGHTLINPELQRLKENFESIDAGPLPLHKAFFSPWRIVEEGGIDPILRGLFASPAKAKKPGQYMNSELTERLFQSAHEIALDLGAMNIQRGRDHALEGYTKWREFCQLPVPKTFKEMSIEITSPEIIQELENLYGHPGNVDLFVGALLEDPIPGGRVGPTFSCLLIDQFRRLRDGDRFWYQNPWVFKSEQLRQIEQVTLGLILCNNGDAIDDVTSDVFILPNLQNPPFLSCFDIPNVDLRMWAECCTDCRNAGFFSSLSHPLGTRFRRDLEFSYKEDREHYPDIGLKKVQNSSYFGEDYYSLNSLDRFNFVTSYDKKSEKLNRNISSKYSHLTPDPLEGYSKDVAEERIEGLEALVEQLTKSIAGLAKKIKRLEKTQNERINRKKKIICRDEFGSVRRRGENWNKDSCTKCSCRAKGVKCRVVNCPRLNCTDKLIHKDDCCPVCSL